MHFIKLSMLYNKLGENPWNHRVWKILGIMGCGIGVYKG